MSEEIELSRLSPEERLALLDGREIDKRSLTIEEHHYIVADLHAQIGKLLSDNRKLEAERDDAVEGAKRPFARPTTAEAHFKAHTSLVLDSLREKNEALRKDLHQALYLAQRLFQVLGGESGVATEIDRWGDDFDRFVVFDLPGGSVSWKLEGTSHLYGNNFPYLGEFKRETSEERLALIQDWVSPVTKEHDQAGIHLRGFNRPLPSLKDVPVAPSEPAGNAGAAFNRLCSSLATIQSLSRRSDSPSVMEFDPSTFKAGLSLATAAAQELVQFAMPYVKFDTEAKTLTGHDEAVSAARDQLRRNL